MDQKNVKKAFDGLFEGAADAKTAVGLARAEQAMIAYYFDVLKANVGKAFSGDTERVPVKDMQDAVRAVNAACANQKAPYLFSGRIDNPADLFAFAKNFADAASAAA